MIPDDVMKAARAIANSYCDNWTERQCADDIAHAIMAEREAKWQPIATAPKDGEYVDLWVYGERVPDCRFSKTMQRWEVYWLDGFDDMSWVKVDGEPTHWMHLPQPPSGKESER